MNNDYLVSIRLMTFMHEAFIRDAMDGIMMQQTKFKVEVVVGDDFSTDRTLEIIKGYQNKENIHIRILDRKKGDDYWQQRQKLGRLYNFTNILDNCHGKYVAILDGDDYWTDPLKLQKQVDFLEVNKEYTMCGAIAQCVKTNHESKDFFNDFIAANKSILEVEDFLSGYPIHISTVLFRNNILRIPNWFVSITNGDVCLFALIAEKGHVGFINEPVSVYRINDKGFWASASLESRYYAFKNTVNHLNKHFKGQYKTQQLRWEYNEAKKVSDIYLTDKAFGKYVKFIFKNYHRYFWRFIWLPKQTKIINNTKQALVTFWVKFRMFIGLRTRIRKLKSHLSKKV